MPARRGRPGLRCARGGSRTEAGAAAVEFALVVPLLLLVLLGIIGYGYMLSFRQAISQAAAEGVRAAAVAPAGLGSDALRERARQAVNQGLGSYGVSCTATGALRYGGTDAGTCTVSPPQACTGSTVGARCVEVVLDYDYREHPLIPGLPGVLLPDQLRYVTSAQVS